MCIIITKEKNAKPLPKEIFENCWDNNPDGAGILYNDGNMTYLYKGIMKKEEFLKTVELANKKENSFLIHTRIATHGSVKPENTHPFISQTIGFAHNGTMQIVPDGDKTDSETFFLHTIANKSFKWCKDNKFLLDMATHGNRCVIFDMETGDLLHLCEKDWKTNKKYEGYMFSNESYSYRYQRFNYKGYKYDKYDKYDDYDFDDYSKYGCYDYDKVFDKSAKKKINDKRTVKNVDHESLKRNKIGMIIGRHDWMEMYLSTFAEKGNTDKYKMKNLISDLLDESNVCIYYDGKESFSANAVSVMKSFIQYAYDNGYNIYDDVMNAFSQFIDGIYGENKETEDFVSELKFTYETFK